MIIIIIIIAHYYFLSISPCVFLQRTFRRGKFVVNHCAAGRYCWKNNILGESAAHLERPPRTERAVITNAGFRREQRGVHYSYLRCALSRRTVWYYKLLVNNIVYTYIHIYIQCVCVCTYIVYRQDIIWTCTTTAVSAVLLDTRRENRGDWTERARHVFISCLFNIISAETEKRLAGKKKKYFTIW